MCVRVCVCVCACVCVCVQALAKAMDDAKKFCTNSELPPVFDEVVYELECSKAVVAKDTRAVMVCLDEMTDKVSESFLNDKPLCM